MKKLSIGFSRERLDRESKEEVKEWVYFFSSHTTKNKESKEK
jgi:hypothetical protein